MSGLSECTTRMSPRAKERMGQRLKNSFNQFLRDALSIPGPHWNESTYCESMYSASPCSSARKKLVTKFRTSSSLIMFELGGGVVRVGAGVGAGVTAAGVIGTGVDVSIGVTAGFSGSMVSPVELAHLRRKEGASATRP